MSEQVLEMVEKDGVYYHDGLKATFNTGDTRPRGRVGPTPSEKDDGTLTTGKVAFWGENNDHPQEIVEVIQKSDILQPLIVQSAKMMIGQGLVYGTTDIDEVTGEEVLKPMQVPEIEDLLEDFNSDLYLYESAIDWFTSGNAFQEIQMNFGGTVAGLYCNDFTRCRLSRKDPKGRITTAFVDGDWPGRYDIRKETIAMPALDPYYRIPQQIRASKADRFMLPIRILAHDRDYYGRAPWHGLIDSGVLEIAADTLSWRKFFLKNAMTLRYHIEVDSRFWTEKYPGFLEKPKEDQKTIKQNELDAFVKWGTGVEKSGKTLMTTLLMDPVSKVQWSLWKITPFKLEVSSGAYIPDGQDSDFRTARSFMDPTLFGIAPGKDRNSAGSGSDKRIAHTHHVLDSHSDANLLLTGHRVMTEVNDWHKKYGNGKRIKWRFRGYHAATQDRVLGAIAAKKPTDAPPNDGAS